MKHFTSNTSTFLLGSLILCGFAFTPHQALSAKNELEKPETIENERLDYESGGILSGIALGAITAGPAGAIVMATSGGWLGNKLHQAKRSKMLQSELAATLAELTQLERTNLALTNELQHQRQQLASNSSQASPSECCEAGELTLYFRTNSEILEPHYIESLQTFAKLAAKHPEATITVQGFADPRGKEQGNLLLSVARINSVIAQLKSYGISIQRLQREAHGETSARYNAEDIEGLFYERRVQLKLSVSNAQLLTQTP
jgi:outer membrane protein OmpA-like peptidoglycan-associated protein